MSEALPCSAELPSEAARVKKTVLLIHGVGVLGQMGPWHAPVKQVLEPHFNVVEIKYPEYRWLGFISLVLDLKVLVVAVVVGVLFHTFAVRHLMTSIVAVLVSSSFGAGIRYRRAFSRIVKLSDPFLVREAPHVIAHSLGTQFLGTVLLRRADARFHRVILSGAVLPSNYPWRDILRRGSVKVVRNEIGGRDVVPLLARAVSRIGLLRSFGSAGSTGFDQQPAIVETVDASETSPSGASFEHHAPIQNVICRNCKHSDVFSGVPLLHFAQHSALLSPHDTYAARVWLPFLLGLDGSR